MSKRKYIYLVVTLMFTQAFLHAQISPGDLAEVHAHLEGISKCTLCHELGNNVTNEKCLDCHTEIKTRVSQNTGYHASSEIKGKACASCHNDHHGRNFQIIRFNTEQFDHQLTGYELLGAHKTAKCEECHQKKYIADPQLKEKQKTFLGLGTSCLNCHEDFHQKTLSEHCADCHDFNKFRPAPKFDHNKSAFVLRGKHNEVDCIKCHPMVAQGGRELQQFKGVEFNNCTNCHKDVHNNKFGQDCKSCHNEESFFVIKSMEQFDHSKTNFKLTGSHQRLDCKKCHKTKYTDPIKHERCDDCHTDYHEKQFVKNGKTPDCKDCHTVFEFRGSTYTIDQHNAGVFPLEGAHMATPCFVCHLKDNKWKFKQIGKTCVDCHKDIHLNYISPEYYPESSCNSCHSVESWRYIQFDHSKTKYNLLGAHQKQSCRACHFKRVENGDNNQKFKGLSTDCVSCHQDVHEGQFAINDNTDCSRCHINDHWKPEKFDHNNTRFPLDGRHANVACFKCHKQLVINERKVTQYKLEEFKCENCH